jgi:hypothetical protein
MKAGITLIAAGLFLAGCAKQDNSAAGSSPNTDTGMAQQNTVVNAQPDEDKATAATAASANGNVPPGPGVNEKNVDPTNGLAKPQHPPAR